jgi:predicted nucleic acid-binding Zn ribbon protein
MPTYLYAVVGPDGEDGELFEVVQRMSDPPLEKHPETGVPVRRVLTAPNLSLRYGEGATKKALSDRNLERLGFTKYQNAGGGRFERLAGKGPDTISAD